MIDTILQIQKDSLSTTTISKATDSIISSTDASISFWFWIALVEFLVITVLAYKVSKIKTNLDFADMPDDKLKSAKSTDIDMGNLMQSINESKDIYKELSRLCHPDRFINSDKHETALALFQEISNNKRNYKVLSHLKERAVIELEIKIK